MCGGTLLFSRRDMIKLLNIIDEGQKSSVEQIDCPVDLLVWASRGPGVLRLEPFHQTAFAGCACPGSFIGRRPPGALVVCLAFYESVGKGRVAGGQMREKGILYLEPKAGHRG